MKCFFLFFFHLSLINCSFFSPYFFQYIHVYELSLILAILILVTLYLNLSMTCKNWLLINCKVTRLRGTGHPPMHKGYHNTNKVLKEKKFKIVQTAFVQGYTGASLLSSRGESL